MTRQLLEAILDNGVSNPHYFEGRLLTAAALREDQDAHRARQRHLGRALGRGVVEGMWITIESTGGADAPPLLSVEGGLAINGNGQTLELPAREVVALARTVASAPTGAGLFRTCEPPTTQVQGAGEGFYVLTIAPASGFRGRAPMSGLSEPSAGSGCGSRSAIEGVRLRLVPLDPLAVAGPETATGRLLKDELLGVTSEAGLSRLRNVVAHLCLGTEPLSRFAVDPFARETLKDGGSEPALAHYGALDDLAAAGLLSDCDVPLAMLHWRVDGLVFVDNWSVRRRVASPAVAAAWPTSSGGRRRAEAEAVLFQFQEQLGALVARSSAPAAIRAIECFRWLPPVGFLPLPGGGRRGIARIGFFSGMTTREPLIYMDGARLSEFVSDALSRPPLRPDTSEFVWTYRARENHPLPGEIATTFPYLIFASGHVPFVGTARFDLARWDRSNFGLL
jgi:hypothetical protein